MLLEAKIREAILARRRRLCKVGVVSPASHAAMEGPGAARKLACGGARTTGILIWEYGSNDMGLRMKTTVEISDALLDAAKRTAAERGTTLRSLVEEGLRHVLEEHHPSINFALRDASVGGRGLQEGVGEGNWEQIVAIAYEGRGG